MRLSTISLLTILAAVTVTFDRDARTQEPEGLRPPAAFDGIANTAVRSQTIFTEVAKVITHPRCMNCHPAGDHPTQGNDLHAHVPLAARGGDDEGVPGNTCAACHTDRNTSVLADADARFQSIPGNPRWGLAPKQMAWQGKSIGEICEQIKDPDRNGGRSLELLHDHFADDDLVGWAWHPGPGRAPAPGTQKQFGALIKAWIDTGAKCPDAKSP